MCVDIINLTLMVLLAPMIPPHVKALFIECSLDYKALYSERTRFH